MSHGVSYDWRMNGTVLILHLWSVVAGLGWIWLMRKGVDFLAGSGGSSENSGESGTSDRFRGGGHFIGGSALAFVVFLLALGRPLPWLLVDIHRATSLGAAVLTALFEELSKVGLFFLLLFGSGAVQNRREGAESAAWIAVGFAVSQNAFYFYRYPELEMLIRPLMVTGIQTGVAALWGYRSAGLVIGSREQKAPERGGTPVWCRAYRSEGAASFRGERF